jgi:hypothetical protein
MRRITFTALGSALMALSLANAANAAARQHARRAAMQPRVNINAEFRDSRAGVGPAYQTYDARAWGGAVSAPAGR